MLFHCAMLTSRMFVSYETLANEFYLYLWQSKRPRRKNIEKKNPNFEILSFDYCDCPNLSSSSVILLAPQLALTCPI